MRSLPILFVLGACAATGPIPSVSDGAELARQLQGRVAGEPVSCVATRAGHGLTIIDRGTVAFGGGGTLWVNRLASDCPSLRPFDTLIVETHGARYCRGDHVRALPSGTSIPGPICVLGDFVPYRRAR